MLGAGSNHVGGRIWPAGRQLSIPELDDESEDIAPYWADKDA